MLMKNDVLKYVKNKLVHQSCVYAILKLILVKYLFYHLLLNYIIFYCCTDKKKLINKMYLPKPF